MQQRRFKQILGRSRPKRRTDAMGPKEWSVEHTLGSGHQGGNFGAWHVFEWLFCYRGSGQKAAREARGKCCGCENSSEISREESREGHEIALEAAAAAAAAVSLQILGAPRCSPV